MSIGHVGAAAVGLGILAVPTGIGVGIAYSNDRADGRQPDGARTTAGLLAGLGGVAALISGGGAFTVMGSALALASVGYIGTATVLD